MKHDKKEKGDLAVAKTICDLTEKGYSVFMPTISEHLPIDLIAYKDGKCVRIQCKYSTGKVRNKTSWSDKHGSHAKIYDNNDFDYYALYLPDLDLVIYPHIIFGGINIRTSMPNSSIPFYWYEDFLSFTDNASKKNIEDFGLIPQKRTYDYVPKLSTRKVIRPTKKELEIIVWQLPTTNIAKNFGVSDKAVEKWCKSYGILKPPRGYWTQFKKSS